MIAFYTRTDLQMQFTLKEEFCLLPQEYIIPLDYFHQRFFWWNLLSRKKSGRLGWKSFWEAAHFMGTNDHKFHCKKYLKIKTLRGCIYTIQVLRFADASTEAIDCSVLHIWVIRGTAILVHLPTVKTKVAPLKTISLPRLEFSGTLSLVRLHQSITIFLSLLPQTGLKIYLFTDSYMVKQSILQIENFLCESCRWD